MSNNEDVSNSLISAVRKGKLDRVRELISKFGLSYSAAWSEGYTLLLDAVDNKHTMVTNLLLSSGSPVNMEDKEKSSNTPLHFAVRNGDMEIVEMLIGKGAKVSTITKDGISPLHIAAEKGYLQIVECLLKYGAYVNSGYSKRNGNTPTDDYTPLCVAVENGNEKMIKLLISYGANVNSKAIDDIAPLHIAAKKGYLQIVDLLLKHGAYVDSTYSKRGGTTPMDGYTPLCFAVDRGNEEIVRLLSNQGANIDVRATNSLSPLHIAVKREHLKIIELLLKHGASIDFTISFGTKTGYTPLFFAVQKGKIEIIKLLISHGAEINTKTKIGVTPLYISVDKGDLSTVEYLLDNGANVNSGYNIQTRSMKGYTPLHHAVEKCNEEIVKLLISKGADVNSKGYDGKAPLHLAARRGLLQIAEELLKAGACANFNRCGDYTPLCFAVQNRHEKIVKLLLENGACVNSKEPSGNSVLYYSLNKFGPINLLLVQHILKYSPDINLPGNRRAYRTAMCECAQEVLEVFIQFNFIIEPEESYDYYKLLYAAVENRYLRLVEQFLNKREEIAKLSKTHVTDANAKDETEIVCTTNPTQKLNPALLTPALKKKHKELVELLLHYGANINAFDEYGRAALHFTSINENQFNLFNKTVTGDIAKSLLSWGADVDTRNGIFTTLHVAVVNGYVKVVEALLEHNADVNSAPKFGITPLHISAKTGNKVISKMLLNKGANINAKEHNGLTALHLASGRDQLDVVEILLRCGAEVNSDSELGLTPLHIAAQRGYLNVVNILLKFGAKVDSQDEYGRTAIHGAAREGHIQVVNALLKQGYDINVKSMEGYSSIDYAEGENEYRIDYDFDYHFFKSTSSYDNRHETIVETLEHHIVKLKTANLYVNEENLKSISRNKDFNDIRCKCEAEIASMKSEKISNANVSFFDILTKDTSRVALYAENEDIVQVLKSEDYKIKFPIYAEMIEINFRKGKRRKMLLEEGSKCINHFFNNGHELPYTCKRKIFSYLGDNDLKILTRTFYRRKDLLEQGYRFFHFLFISFPDFPYKCTEKIFSYLSDEDLRILVEACKPANVILQY